MAQPKNYSFGNRAMDTIFRKPLGYEKAAYAGNRKFAGALGRGLMTIPGGYMALGAVMGVMSHDPSQNTLASHMAQEGMKIGADAVGDMALFGVGAMFGLPGLIGAGALSIGSHTLGLNPGAAVDKYLGEAKRLYRKEMGLGATPIKQNERTMRSMQQAMRLVGQSGRTGMLGNEAQYMHN